jgi:hypothetical protein
VYAGVQCVGDSRLRHISPVLKWMFGWQMGVSKDMVGGESGYVGGTRRVRCQRPAIKPCQWVEWRDGTVSKRRGEGMGRDAPSYALPCGPLSTASHFMSSSSLMGARCSSASLGEEA